MKIAKKFTQEILHELKMSTAQGAASPEQDDERVRSPEGWTGLSGRNTVMKENETQHARLKQPVSMQI